LYFTYQSIFDYLLNKKKVRVYILCFFLKIENRKTRDRNLHGSKFLPTSEAEEDEESGRSAYTTMGDEKSYNLPC